MTTTLAQTISQAHLQASISYAEYRQMIDELLAEGKTTGNNHSPDMLGYTKMNVQRMKRLDKTTKISEELKAAVEAIKTPQTWLAVTEAWCGDAAQNLPVFAKVAELNPNIEFKLILRDEHLDVIDAHLTNGGRAIPKVIFVKKDALENLEEYATWGPRPTTAQEIVVQRKSEGVPYAKFSEEIHRWYARNKSQKLQSELLEILKTAHLS